MNIENQAASSSNHSTAVEAVCIEPLEGKQPPEAPNNFCEKNSGSDGDGAHLHPRVRPYLHEAVSVRLRRVDADVMILYPELDALLNEARWLVLEPRRSRARGIFICGVNGSGKSSIAKVLAKEYSVAPNPSLGKDQPRVLCINLSGVRTTKAMLSHILEAAKVPLASTRTIHEHERVVIETLRAMGCALLVTDETQDILMGRPTEQVRVIEVLKRLMNELSLPVLALGTPEGKNPFRADPHMAARFETYELPKWQAGDKLAAFLTALEQSLPLKYRSDLARPEIQKLLIAKTGGCLDVMLKRLRLAAKHAIVDGTERITKKLLEDDLLHPPVSALG